MIASCIALLWLAISPAVQEAEESRPTAGSKRESSKTWNALEAEDRSRLAERYERLRSLDPGERERVLARASRFQTEIQRTLDSLTPEERAEIEALSPDERRRVLRGMLAERARVATEKLRARMDEGQRQELEVAEPAERAAIVKRIQREQRARFADQLGRDLGLSERELRRVRSGTRDERRAALVSAARRSANRYVESYGLPAGVTEEAWSRVSSAGDRGFVRGYLRIRAQHPEFGIPPKVWERRSQRRGAMAKRLEALARPSTKLRARYPDAGERELRRRAILERRPRIEDLLIRRLAVGEPGAQRLRALDDEAFVRLIVGARKALRRGEDLATDFAKRIREGQSSEGQSSEGPSSEGQSSKGASSDGRGRRADDRRRRGPR